MAANLNVNNDPNNTTMALRTVISHLEQLQSPGGTPMETDNRHVFPSANEAPQPTTGSAETQM